MTVAVIALLVALSGSAYAALKIGTKNIKDGAVTSSKIRNGAVTQKKSDMMWALVDDTGDILRSSGGIKASLLASGVYVVEFPRALTGRPIEVTVKHKNSDPAWGISAVAAICGGSSDSGELINCGVEGPTSRYLYVRTGYDASTAESQSFWVSAG